jgi:hypothetical protein
MYASAVRKIWCGARRVPAAAAGAEANSGHSRHARPRGHGLGPGRPTTRHWSGNTGAVCYKSRRACPACMFARRVVEMMLECALPPLALALTLALALALARALASGSPGARQAPGCAARLTMPRERTTLGWADLKGPACPDGCHGPGAPARVAPPATRSARAAARSPLGAWFGIPRTCCFAAFASSTGYSTLCCMKLKAEHLPAARG